MAAFKSCDIVFVPSDSGSKQKGGEIIEGGGANGGGYWTGSTAAGARDETSTCNRTL